MTVTTGTHPVVDRFLAGITAGALPHDLHASDAVLDATVPGWRFQVAGPEAIAAEYARWFGQPSTLRHLDRRPLPDGELVRYVQDLTEAGTDYTVHHMHLLTVADDRIVRDVVFCGGRWGPEAVAKMGAAAHAG